MGKRFLVFLILFLFMFQSVVIATGISPSETVNSAVSLEFDKTTAKVGEIIKASLKIQGFDTSLSAYQVNIKFDPDVFQAVNPYSGEPYEDYTFPKVGGGNGYILLTEGKLPSPIYSKASHDLSKGILNFGQNWSKLVNNPSKNDVYAEIGFKVLKEETAKVAFEGSDLIQSSKSGTLLFDLDGNLISNYNVIQAPVINDVTVNSAVSLEFDKTTAKVGEIIKASLKIQGFGTSLSAYQVSIKFDPDFLQAVNPYTGTPYEDYTFPIVGGKEGGDFVITSESASLIAPKKYKNAQNELKNGILNFGEIFSNIKSSNPYANNIYAEIGFKVLKENTTKVVFQDTDKMTGTVNGTLLFDWDGTQIKGYAVNQPSEINSKTNSNCNISGYVMSSNGVKSGFKVMIIGTNHVVITDSNGRFEFPNGVQINDNFSIRIGKRGYLDREINYIIPKSSIKIGSEEDPIDIWPGDIVQSDNINAINMVDIMEIAKRFNCVKGDSLYDSDIDFTGDGSINLADIMIMCKHFGSNVFSYPELMKILS